MAGDDAAGGSYPNPVLPDERVFDIRRRRLRDLQRVVAIGIAVRGSVVVVELVGYLRLGSVALLADAIASLVDVVSSIVLLAAFRLAVRPPDDDHPFGHGRYEPLAGLQIGLLITAAGLMLLSQLLLTERPDVFLPRPGAYLVPLAATIALAGTCGLLFRIGRSNRSSAVTAEAQHYLADAATSLATTVALFVGEFLPESATQIDLVTAVLLAALTVGVGLLAVRENLHQLMDRTPRGQYFDRVRDAALTVDGVEEVEKIRIQAAGPDAHVDIDIEVDPLITVEHSHRIAQQVRAAVQTEWPMVLEVVVHVEPYYADDH